LRRIGGGKNLTNHCQDAFRGSDGGVGSRRDKRKIGLVETWGGCVKNSIDDSVFFYGIKEGKNKEWVRRRSGRLRPGKKSLQVGVTAPQRRTGEKKANLDENGVTRGAGHSINGKPERKALPWAHCQCNGKRLSRGIKHREERIKADSTAPSFRG